ncbi:MAG TPA: radical SAM protein [Kofleriaceae bacterium]|nr:radical SAM protein [Kofleriaceae bacterium]
MAIALNDRFEYTGAPIRRIKLLELRSERIDFLKHAILPWHGTVLIASLLAQEGYEVEALVEGVSSFDEDDLADCDALLVHLTAGNIERTARAVKRVVARRDIPVIGGGGLGKVVPSAVAPACDVVVRGEGEDTVVELLEAMGRRGDIRAVAGLSFWHGGRLHHTAPRAFTRRLDVPSRMDIIRGYRPMGVVEQAWRRRYFYMTVEASRGCPFACKFCITPDLYGSYRAAAVDRVIGDLRDRLRYSRRVWFVDNLFAVKRDFTVALLTRMIDERLGERGNYTCFLRVENARDEELLPLLRRAGFTNIYVGFESLSASTQGEWNKSFRLREMADCVETYHRHGLRVQGSFIFGSDDQDPGDIEVTLRWAMDNDVDYVSFYVLIPTQMAENACIPRRRMLAPSWDYVNGNYVTHFPLRMPPSVLQRDVREALFRFYSPRQLPRRLARIGAIGAPHTFAAASTAIYGTLRLHGRDLDDYTAYLRTVERPYYDAGGRLLEDRLPPAGLLPDLPFLDSPDPAVRLVKAPARAGKFQAASCNEAGAGDAGVVG